MKEQMNKLIKDLENKLLKDNTPEVKKALEMKLKMLKGDNTVCK